MDRILKPASLVLLLLSSASAQTKGFGEKPQLKGAVRDIVLAEARPGRERATKRTSLFKYAAAGDLLEHLTYAEDGSLSSSTTYEYDARGNCILETRRGRESEGKTAWVYDGDGRKIERSIYDAEGSLSSKAVRSHQPDGSILQTTDYFKKKAPDGRTVDKLDSSERVLESNHRDGRKEVYHYGADGAKAERTSYDQKGGVKNRVAWSYDAGKRAGEVSYFRGDGSPQWTLSHSNNQSGHLIKSEYAGKAGHATSQHDFEYDATGNWIKRTSVLVTLRSGKTQSSSTDVFYRTITYYDPADIASLKQRRTANDVVVSGVLRGSAVVRAEPMYPRAARDERVFGTVIVEVTVDEEGNVISARAKNGPMQLRSAAVAAAKEWKFTPTLLSGFPVKVIGTLTFNFNP